MEILHLPVVRPPVPPYVALKPRTHRFQIALTEGDTLVLTTDLHDENDVERDRLRPVSLFYLNSLNYDLGTWSIAAPGGLAIQGGNRPVALHSLLKVHLSTPMVVVKKAKGYCTMFTMEVDHGYRVHFLDFVKNRLPDVYRQLNLS